MKATVAIIGATGKMGRGLAHRLALADYRVLLIGHNEEHLQQLQVEIQMRSLKADTEILSCETEGSWEADIVIPAVAYCHQQKVAERIRDVVTGKIVVNLTNPFNSTCDGVWTESGTSAAEELQQMLPHSRVVKAYNTVLAADFYTDKIDQQIPDCFLAGNDDESLDRVSQLVRDTGFNPLIAGKLSASRTLENMMVLLTGITGRYHFNRLAGWKVLKEV